MNCPECNGPVSYVGLTAVECTTSGCINYVRPLEKGGPPNQVLTLSFTKGMYLQWKVKKSGERALYVAKDLVEYRGVMYDDPYNDAINTYASVTCQGTGYTVHRSRVVKNKFTPWRYAKNKFTAEGVHPFCLEFVGDECWIQEDSRGYAPKCPAIVVWKSETESGKTNVRLLQGNVDGLLMTIVGSNK